MLRVGLIKHHCPFRAVAAAVSGTHIIAHLPFLPFLSERSSVGCFGEIDFMISSKRTPAQNNFRLALIHQWFLPFNAVSPSASIR